MSCLRTCALLLLLAVISWSQDTERRYYVTRVESLSGAGFAVTVQQPSSGARKLRFDGGTVRCTAATTITMEKNGATATATPSAAQSLDERGPSAVSQVYVNSNVGAGTLVSQDSRSANELFPFSGGLVLAGSGKNFTLKSTAITGTCTVQIWFSEP